MRLSYIFVFFILLGLLTGCTHTTNPDSSVSEEDITTSPEDNSIINNNENITGSTELVENTPPTDTTSDVTDKNQQLITEEPLNKECTKEVYVLVANLSEGSYSGKTMIISEPDRYYEIFSTVQGTLYVSLSTKKNGPFIARMVIPLGEYAPKKAIKISDQYAIKILNRTFERTNKIYSKETLSLELYNLTDTCIAPEFETEPLISISCSVPSVGNCIGSRYDEYWIGVEGRNEKKYSKFELLFSIDGGEPLVPFSDKIVLFGSTFSNYRIPAYTFAPGTHQLRVDVETEDGIIFTKNFELIILPDDKVAFRIYRRAQVCDTADDGDFIRYYDNNPDGSIILKHNYYPDNITLKVGECITTTTGFDVCDYGEISHGLYDYKILTLKNAKSVCPWIFDVAENCEDINTLEVGDTFENRFREEYELVKIYDSPKLVLFKNINKNWFVYYPYDVNLPYSNEIKIISVTGNSATVSHFSGPCYQ